MKIFILEDDAKRTEWFNKKFIQNEVIVSDNVKDALAILESNDFDIFFLDHDLGGQVYVDSGEFNTGNTISKYLSENMRKQAPVVVHSWNAEGARSMLNNLLSKKIRCVYTPFGSREFLEIVEDIIYMYNDLASLD